MITRMLRAITFGRPRGMRGLVVILALGSLLLAVSGCSTFLEDYNYKPVPGDFSSSGGGY